jgi:hypothetical protein
VSRPDPQSPWPGFALGSISYSLGGHSYALGSIGIWPRSDPPDTPEPPPGGLPALPALPADGTLTGPLAVRKLTGLTVQHDQVMFYGQGLGDAGLWYPADSPAACHAAQFRHQFNYAVPNWQAAAGTSRLPQPHEAPHDYCTCGFYANPALQANRADRGRWWLMEAVLSGRYVEHSNGYRFARQKVTAVGVPAGCWICGGSSLRSDAAPDVAYLAWDRPQWSGLGGLVSLTSRGGLAIRAAHRACTDQVAAGFRLRDEVAPFTLLELPELRSLLSPVELLPAADHPAG